MSQTSHLKATALTNLDASPILEPNTGAGGATLNRSADGYAVPLANDATTSTYQLVRIPSTAIVKQVKFGSQAQAAGKFNLGLYFSTSLKDGTAASNQNSDGTPKVAAASADSFFATDVDCASAVQAANYTNGNGTTTSYTFDLMQEPIWKALGLSTDPGGFFDVCATCHTTAVTTGTGKIYCEVVWTP